MRDGDTVLNLAASLRRRTDAADEQTAADLREVADDFEVPASQSKARRRAASVE